MKSFSALTLLSAFVLALTTLSSNHNNCSGQRLIQGVRVNQGRENTAAEAGAAGTSAATVEGNDPDLLIPPSFLRRTYYRRLNLINNRNAVLQKRGLLDTLLPPTPHATDTPTANTPETSLSPPPATTDDVVSATTASAPFTFPSPEGVSSSPPEGVSSSSPPETTHETTTDAVPPTTPPGPPVTSDPPTPPPPVTTDPAPPTSDPVPPTTDPVPPVTATSTEKPVITTTTTTTTTTEEPTAPPTSAPPPETSAATVPPVKSTQPPVVPSSTKSRPVPPPLVTSSGGSHNTGSGHKDPSATASSAGVRPSEASTSGTSSSNKTAITIGVVIGAIVVCAGIGVWVFRKWKLSPSRQFKSKIRNSSNGGSVGGFGSGRSLEDDDVEYANYTDIFRPTAHDSSLPITASSMTTASASAAAVGSGQGANLARGGSRSGPSSTVSGSSPPMQHAQQQMYYDDPYGQQQVARSGSNHQQHMSLSSMGTVPDYSQYRYPGTQQPLMSGGHGYDSGVTGSILGGAGGGGGQSGPQVHQPHASYASSDYPANDHFLRELRE